MARPNSIVAAALVFALDLALAPTAVLTVALALALARCGCQLSTIQ